jgi:FkbM family methyltransferase
MIGRLSRRSPPVIDTDAPERRAFFEQAGAFTGYVSVELDGVQYLVATGDPGMGEDLFVRGLRPELVVLQRVAHALAGVTGSLVDVGANVGTTVLPALKLGFDDAVAIEPGPETARLLRANCALNGRHDQVTVVEAAASDHEGEAQLDVSGSPGRYAIARNASQATVQVAVVSIDGLVQRGTIDPRRVSLFWIDAQGHERRVLEGAMSLLAERPPLVLAIRQRKLERDEGGLGGLLDVLTPGYATAIDLRAPNLLVTRWKPKARPIAELPRIVEERRTTDVLFLPR